MKSIQFNPSQIEATNFQVQGCRATSLFNTDQDNNVWLYFAMKEKHDAQLENGDVCLPAITEEIKRLRLEADVVVYPQSSKCLNPWLAVTVAVSCGADWVEIRKRSKDEVIELARGLSWRKEEWAAQERRFAEMDDSFEINKIKSNQRHRYVGFLFEPVRKDWLTGKILIVDDSIFSGTTISASLHAIDHRPAEVFSLFWCKSLISG